MDCGSGRPGDRPDLRRQRARAGASGSRRRSCPSRSDEGRLRGSRKRPLPSTRPRFQAVARADRRWIRSMGPRGPRDRAPLPLRAGPLPCLLIPTGISQNPWAKGARKAASEALCLCSLASFCTSSEAARRRISSAHCALVSEAVRNRAAEGSRGDFRTRARKIEGSYRGRRPSRPMLQGQKAGRSGLSEFSNRP